MKSRFLILLTLLLLTDMASAATITVRKDGSGDHVTIQPALNAAASGDTILIGPGEFTEYSMVRLDGYAWDVVVFAYSELANLTIIGAGAEQTIIGPTVPMLDYSTYSAKCLVWINGTELTLRGVTIRNCYEGLHVPQGSLDVEGCRFLGHAIGVIWLPQGAGGRFIDIEFTSPATQPEAVGIQGPFSGITFTDIISVDGGRFYVSGAGGVTFENCDLAGGVSGMSCVSGPSVVVRNSHLHGASNQQLSVYNASCTVENSVLEGGDGAIYLSSYSSMTVTGSVLSGSFAAIGSNGAEQLTVHGSHIFRGTQWAVWADGPTTGGHHNYDLTNNYWGTSSAADIAAWIWDANDSSANWGTVIFQPFSAQEVPTETTSWGDLKALFR